MPLINHADTEWVDLVPGVKLKIPVVRAAGSGALTMGQVMIAPGGAIPLHTHKVEEAVMITGGTGEGRVGQEIYQLRVGFTMLAPANTPHSVRNTGSDALTAVIAFPSVDVERFWVNE